MDELILVDGTLSTEISQEIARNELLIKQLSERQKEIKDGLLKAMREANIVKIDNDNIKVTYVASTTQERLDGKELKKDLPDIYNTYCKISEKSDYIKIEVK